MTTAALRPLRDRAGMTTVSTLARSKLLTVAIPAALLAWLLCGDWIAAACILVLALIWHYLRGDEGPPVLALALTFQWLQVTSGLLYYGFTGRAVEAVLLSDYRPMVLIGLGCLLALTAGLTLGIRFGPASRRQGRPAFASTLSPLLLSYLITTAGIGLVQSLAWRFSFLTQGILALSAIRYVLLYLLFRRFSAPHFQWPKIGVLLALEMILGFTGYFASFREPLMFLALVLLEQFDSRKLRDWLRVGALATGTLFLGLLWLGIRTTYRADIRLENLSSSRVDRAERVASLSGDWLQRGPEKILADTDYFVHRLWAIYYPALALKRVPSILPHEDGRILGAAVKHIFTPRLFFRDKAVLASDSELVRTYSGVWVAGVESNTSIAFGYAAESYVDFGVPLMFLPILLFGLLMGLLYRLFLRLIWHRELAVALVSVIFWFSLYLFERSWVKWLGSSFTMMIFLGSAVFVLDRLLWNYRQRPAHDRSVLLKELAALTGKPGRIALPIATGATGKSESWVEIWDESWDRAAPKWDNKTATETTADPAAESPPRFPPPPWA